MNARPKLTKPQLEALIEGAGPRKRAYGLSVAAGGGVITADARVEKALIRMGLAIPSQDYPFRGGTLWISDAGRIAATEALGRNKRRRGFDLPVACATTMRRSSTNARSSGCDAGGAFRMIGDGSARERTASHPQINRPRHGDY